MPKVTVCYESFRDHQLQVIEVSANINSREDARNLNYTDVEINLSINHKRVAEISYLMDKVDTPNSNALIDMVDAIDWEKEFVSQTEEVCHA